MNLDLEHLKALAKAATKRGALRSKVVDCHNYATPEIILALIAENERLATKVKMMLGEDCGFKMLSNPLRSIPACKFYQDENERLRKALVEYGRAGIGQSTDHRIQLSAWDLANEALGGPK